MIGHFLILQGVFELPNTWCPICISNQQNLKLDKMENFTQLFWDSSIIVLRADSVETEPKQKISAQIVWGVILGSIDMGSEK